MGKNKERSNLGEFIINFALVYSLFLGTIFVFYSMVRGLFPLYYHLIPFALFMGYFVWWVIDKLDKERIVNEHGTEVSNTI